MSGHFRIIIAVMMCAATLPAYARTAPNKEIVLYTFQRGSDGAAPSAGLIYENGFLIGTTATGGTGCGTSGCGTVFEIDPDTGAETVIYRFAGGKDGQNPVAGLIYENGLLYGTTEGGGPAGTGTVFSVNPATKQEQIVYSFKGGKDGASPEAELLYDNGILIGTTLRDGPLHYGTVFEVDLSSGTETIIHAFNQESGGGTPQAGVILHGNAIFGTTEFGGRGGEGTVFRVNLATGKESSLYDFSGYADGGAPLAGLIYRDGNLYGTTSQGGAGDGTVFKLIPETRSEIVLHAFTGGTGNNKVDGISPQAGLTYVGELFYRTTNQGGAGFRGTVFKINPRSGGETVLHSFAGGTDGSYPLAGLIYHSRHLYGTTQSGGGTGCGGGGCGVVFKIAP